jgi:hypothetical protein
VPALAAMQPVDGAKWSEEKDEVAVMVMEEAGAER